MQVQAGNHTSGCTDKKRSRQRMIAPYSPVDGHSKNGYSHFPSKIRYLCTKVPREYRYTVGDLAFENAEKALYLFGYGRSANFFRSDIEVLASLLT